jgi:hypothetical protein
MTLSFANQQMITEIYSLVILKLLLGKMTAYLSNTSKSIDMKQIKVINRIPSPSDQIANQLFKPTLFDRITSVGLPIFLAISWLCILGAILFS